VLLQLPSGHLQRELQVKEKQRAAKEGTSERQDSNKGREKEKNKGRNCKTMQLLKLKK
jgi:hypothetical protein